MEQFILYVIQAGELTITTGLDGPTCNQMVKDLFESTTGLLTAICDPSEGEVV